MAVAATVAGEAATGLATAATGGLVEAVGAGATGSGNRTGAKVITGEDDNTVMSTEGFARWIGGDGSGGRTSGSANGGFAEIVAGAARNIAMESGATATEAAASADDAAAELPAGFG